MPAALDLIGHRFGRLVVLQKETVRDRYGKVVWHCQCDCGNCTDVNTKDLRTGNTRSCGCLFRETIVAHGMRNTRVYRIWAGMKVRCSSPKSLYRAKGITVCKRWEKFQNFYKDMGDPPVGTTLDRKNNLKGYSPSNCRWATPATQTLNRLVTRFITYQGETLCVSHWARKVGLRQDTLSWRIRSGWSVEKALTTPVKGANE